MSADPTPTAIAVAKTYALMRERGSVELWFDTADQAEACRRLLRKQARLRHERIGTMAQLAASGPNAGRVLVCAYDPEFESDGSAVAKMVAAGFGA